MRLNVFFLISALTALALSACAGPKSLYIESPFTSEREEKTVAWKSVKRFFTWNQSYGPKMEFVAGDRVMISVVNNLEEWELADKEEINSCPNADPKYKFARAYYQSWRQTIVLKQCTREGAPAVRSFWTYYLPLAEIPLAREEEVISETPSPQPAEERQDAAEGEKESGGPETGAVKKIQPVSKKIKLATLDDFDMWYTYENPEIEVETQEDWARIRLRFLLILYKNRWLYVLNYGDMQTFLDEATVKHLQNDRNWAHKLRENTIYWRALKERIVDITSCRACTDNRGPAQYRGAVIVSQDHLSPRLSCVDMNELLPDGVEEYKLGFAHEGYTTGSPRVGYLLFMKGQSITAFPIGYSGTPDASKAVTFRVVYEE